MGTTLRKFIDAVMPPNNTMKKVEDLKAGDQVVIRKQTRLSGPKTQEVMVGTIAAFAPGNNAIVSLPRPGGAILRTTVHMSQISPVESVYKRTAIQVNPAFRKVF